MRLCFLSLSLSLQDSMDEACAEGMANEHYRLEGRLPSCSSSSLPPLLFCFCTKSRGNTLRSCTPGTRAVPFPCSRSSLPPPHLLLLHTHPLSPNNVLMRSPLPFTPSSPPPPPSRLSSAPPHPPPPAVLHSSMFPPSRCDVILD